MSQSQSLMFSGVTFHRLSNEAIKNGGKDFEFQLLIENGLYFLIVQVLLNIKLSNTPYSLVNDEFSFSFEHGSSFGCP